MISIRSTLKNQFAVRWRRYSQGEQWVLSILMVAAVFVLFLTLVWQPLVDARQGVEAELRAAESDLTWLEQAARRLPGETAAASPAVRDGSQPRQLTSLVNELVQENGLRLSRFEQNGGDRLRVWLDNQAFDAVVRWLAALQSNNVVVHQILMSRAAVPGQVTVRAELAFNVDDT